MMVSGNWDEYPQAQVKIIQPDGTGWHVSHIHVYPPRVVDNASNNLRANTYNFTDWPNSLPDDEIHVPVAGIPVKVFRAADASMRLMTTWPQGLHIDKGVSDGAETAAPPDKHIISITLDEQPAAYVELIPLAVENDRFIWRVFFTYKEGDDMDTIPQPAGWQLPAWNEATLTYTPPPAKGQSKWKLVDARIADNPGDHTLYVEVINANNERDTEAQVHFINANGVVTIKTAEKPLTEPMVNIPIYKNDTYKAFVNDALLSDVVTGLHSRYADSPEYGTTWGHVPYLLQFQEVIGAEELPEPDETLETFIRRKSWDSVGINYNPDAAFSKYATWKSLGKPETNEYDLIYNGTDYLVQGFTGGIVYAVKGDWGNIKHIKW